MVPENTSSLEEIQKIYQDVSEWLKFAEAKHAGLFAAWIAIFISLFSENNTFYSSLKLKSIILVLLLIGASINLCSFIPFLNRCSIIRELCYRKYKSVSGNQVFYQSIFVDTYTGKKYQHLESCNKYKKIIMGTFNINNASPLIDDYIRQVIENATVGTVKIYLFDLSVKYTIVIFVLICCSIIIA